MSTDSALANGRAAAEARMRDRVRIYIQAEDGFDRETGNTIPGTQTVLYTGRARVKPVADAAGEEVQAGEREVVLREIEVSLPWATTLPGSARLLPGARIEVTASNDPRMTGAVLWAKGSQLSAQATAWRIRAEDRS